MNIINKHKTKIFDRGFSVIEVMIAIVILAILGAIAVPSLMNTIQNNYSVSLSNDMIKTLNYARSESMKRSTSISICPQTSSGTGCGSDWSKGWIVYIGSTNYDKNTMTLLRNYSLSGKNASVTKSTVGNLITYNKFGFLSSPTMTLTIYASGCTSNNARSIAISLTGYLEVTKINCP